MATLLKADVPPTPKNVHVKINDITHTRSVWNGMVYYLHNWSFSAQSRAGLPSKSETASESKERKRAGIFNVVREQGQKKVPMHGQELPWFESTGPKEAAPGFSYQLVQSWAKKKRQGGLRSCQQSHIRKWSQSLLHYVSWGIVTLKLTIISA